MTAAIVSQAIKSRWYYTMYPDGSVISRVAAVPSVQYSNRYSSAPKQFSMSATEAAGIVILMGNTARTVARSSGSPRGRGTSFLSVAVRYDHTLTAVVLPDGGRTVDPVCVAEVVCQDPDGAMHYVTSEDSPLPSWLPVDILTTEFDAAMVGLRAAIEAAVIVT